MIKPENKPKNKNLYLIEVTGEDAMYYDKCTPEEKAKKLEDMRLSKEEGLGYNGGLVNLEMTLLTACIYDESTQCYSDTSIYQNKKGKYLKKKGLKYYLNDFKVVDNVG